MNSTKKCAECGRELPLSEYNKAKKNKDGLQDRCRECFSRYNKARYASNKEKHKEKIYAYRAENPYNVLDTLIKTCLKEPTHRHANRALNEAVNVGVIEVPEFCSGCGVSGKETRLSAHHYDYTKPLDVVWVCAKCHRRLDGERRKREGKTPYGQGKAVQMLHEGAVVCTFDTISDAANAVGCSQSSIKQCLAGKSKTAKAFGWRYLKEVEDAQATNG